MFADQFIHQLYRYDKQFTAVKHWNRTRNMDDLLNGAVCPLRQSAAGQRARSRGAGPRHVSLCHPRVKTELNWYGMNGKMVVFVAWYMYRFEILTSCISKLLVINCVTLHSFRACRDVRAIWRTDSSKAVALATDIQGVPKKELINALLNN